MPKRFYPWNFIDIWEGMQMTASTFISHQKCECLRRVHAATVCVPILDDWLNYRNVIDPLGLGKL